MINDIAYTTKDAKSMKFGNYIKNNDQIMATMSLSYGKNDKESEDNE